MKVVLLESGRGNRAHVIETWREKIGLYPSDSITLLSWYPPREMLPVDLHVVFGPVPRVRLRVRSGAVLAEEIRRIREVEERRREKRLDLDDALENADAAAAAEDARQEADDLAEQLPESVVGADKPGQDPAPSGSAGGHAAEDADAVFGEVGEPVGTVSDGTAASGGTAGANPVLALPLHHPDRIKEALRWRLAKMKKVLKGSAPVKFARRGARKAAGGLPTEFALTLARWPGASVVVGNADLVLSLDSRSQKAAWVLAKRVEGPEVVVSYAAAQRVLSMRRNRLRECGAARD